MRLQPLLVVSFRHDFQIRSHVVVAQAAQLCANDFVFADLRGSKVHWNIQAGDKVLLNAKDRHVKRMSHILGVQRQQYWMVHGDDERPDYDIIARCHVVLGIETKIISVGFIYQFGMEGAELAVRTRIAEPKRELFGLHVNMQRVGGRRRNV